MKKVYITAFGETKTILDWSKDKRCVVNYYALHKRIKNNWNLEEAITYISPKANKNYLVNKRFGRLLVLSFNNKTKNGERIWLCKCDCGNNKEVSTGDLTNGNTSSCGCYRRELGAIKFKENYLGYGIAAQNALFSSYQLEAKRRKLAWELDKDLFLSITKKDCYYCGCKPSKIITKGTPEEYIYNGIDRIDSTKGYLKDNILPCCEQCNIMKFDYTTEQFLNKIELIHAKHCKL